MESPLHEIRVRRMKQPEWLHSSFRELFEKVTQLTGCISEATVDVRSSITSHDLLPIAKCWLSQSDEAAC
jgi:hypothetical protein